MKKHRTKLSKVVAYGCGAYVYPKETIVIVTKTLSQKHQYDYLVQTLDGDEFCVFSGELKRIPARRK